MAGIWISSKGLRLTLFSGLHEYLIAEGCMHLQSKLSIILHVWLLIRLSQIQYWDKKYQSERKKKKIRQDVDRICSKNDLCLQKWASINPWPLLQWGSVYLVIKDFICIDLKFIFILWCMTDQFIYSELEDQQVTPPK